MDNRNIKNGNVIRSDGYSDQPYIVITDDNHWLMTVTVCTGEEGQQGQHVISMRSADKGVTWKDETDVSPVTLPESSYSVLYKTAYGRIYCFYNYNADNLRMVKADSPPYPDGYCNRVDTQGHFVYRYSDDNGISWSDRWYDIPQRMFEVDRNNPYGGEIKFFWNVGKPFELDREVYVPLYKIGAFGIGFMRYSEGVLLKCSNINTEKDLSKLVWETLPDGEIGIRAPREESIISEEHSFVTLSDGGIFCVFRTISGHPYCCYSRDKGHTFTEPLPMTYKDGRKMKHPRAANFIWKCMNGKYIYWFHNHGGKWYDDRNPVWLCGAVEKKTSFGTVLAFGEPVPVLYDENPAIRISYPDFVEDNGEYYLTETQKEIARVHKIDKELVEGLWNQRSESDIWTDISQNMPDEKMLSLKENSFSLKFEISEGTNPEILFSTMVGASGIEIRRNSEGFIEILAGDGQRMHLFLNDDELLQDGKKHTVTAVFDAGVCAVYFVTDGRFCDGAEKRQFGFTRFDKELRHVYGLERPRVNKLSKLFYCQGIHLYD